MIKIIAALVIAFSFSFAHAQTKYSEAEVEQIKKTLTEPELVAKVIKEIEREGTKVAVQIFAKKVTVKVVGQLQATIRDDVPMYLYKAVILETETSPQGLGVQGMAWFTDLGLAMTFSPLESTEK